MKKGYSIYGNRRRIKEVDAPPNPDYPIRLYMDESGNGNNDLPLIAGAVASELDANEIEQKARNLYDDLCARDIFDGYGSFDEFREVGFHAATDPYEVAVPFFDLMQREIGYKLYMVMTDRSTLRPLAEKQQIAHLYEILLADLLIQYKNYPLILCSVEENEGFGSMIRELPARSRARALSKIDKDIPLPRLEFELIPKKEIVSMAIVDYGMMAVSRWTRTGYDRDLGKRGYREFRQVEPTISILASLEKGIISTRKRDLH